MDDADEPSDDLLERALASLCDLLGPGWEARRHPQAADLGGGGAVSGTHVRLTPPDRRNPSAEVHVVARHGLTPRDVEQQIAPVHDVLRHVQPPRTLLVVSPWLGSRTRQELSDRGIGHLDLTGNVSVTIAHPAVRLHTHGATRSPAQSPTASRVITLAGARAGRVVRFLVDHAPPYRAMQIAETTGVSLPWVSRLLGQLDDQLLIRRGNRLIHSVDWRALLRARAENYDLLRSNRYHGALAVRGTREFLTRLHEPRTVPVAITGPLAARAVAPLGVGGQLMVYVGGGPGALREVMSDSDLLPTEEGADVLLLEPQDDVVFERLRTVDGLPHVALSQLVLDCLAGPGRGPAEAEAVLDRMAEDELSWRRPWER